MGERKNIFTITWYVKTIGIIALIISVLLLVVLLTQWNINSKADLYWVIALFIFFTVFAILLMLLFFYRLIILEDRIIEENIFKKPKEIKFNSVTKARVKFSNNAFFIESDRVKIKITNTVKGFDKAVRLIVEKIGMKKVKLG